MPDPFDVLRWLWASPATLVGLGLAAPALASGATLRRVDNVLEIAGGLLLRRLPSAPRFGFVAITFGHVVVGVDHQCLARVRAHERVHVRQYERWGLLFFPLYLASSLVQIVRGRDPYLDNVFEREAFATCDRGGKSSPLNRHRSTVAHDDRSQVP